MGSYQHRTKQIAAQSSQQHAPPTVTPQPPQVQQQPIQAKSNEEGLAEHAERLRKFQRLGNSMIQMGPPRFDNSTTSSLQPQPWIQRKLTIGKPGDKYEQEADRVASQVAQHINTPTFKENSIGESIQREKDLEGVMYARGFQAAIQRKQAIESGEVSPDLESGINRVRGSGQPLDAGLQQSMGQAMGADFSGVRVHTDAQSDQLNQSIQARAFTTGQDVFFREGTYQPRSKGGQELIAHELTHVVQQNRGLAQPSIVPDIVRSSTSGIDRSKSQLKKQAPKTNIKRSKTEELGKVRAKVTQHKSPKERSKVKQSFIHIGSSQAIIQRLVGRVDSDKKKNRKKSRDFVAAYEVDRMIEFLKDKYGGPVVDVKNTENIEISAGEHWFAGHGDLSEMGNLSTREFNSKLDFRPLKDNDKVILNIISCQLGSIREKYSFANDLRRRIQNNYENEGKTIIIKSATSYVFLTEGIQASYPGRENKKAINEIHTYMSKKEEEIDEKHGEHFWEEIKNSLNKLFETEKIEVPSKKKLNTYKSAFEQGTNSDKIEKFISSKDRNKETFLKLLENIAKEKKIFLYSASVLIEIINNEEIKEIYEKTLNEIKKESETLWLSIEEKMKADQNLKKSDEVFDYRKIFLDESKKGFTRKYIIKHIRDNKDSLYRAKYAWAEYSTKGKYKNYEKWENPSEEE